MGAAGGGVIDGVNGVADRFAGATREGLEASLALAGLLREQETEYNVDCNEEAARPGCFLLSSFTVICIHTLLITDVCQDGRTGPEWVCGISCG